MVEKAGTPELSAVALPVGVLAGVATLSATLAGFPSLGVLTQVDDFCERQPAAAGDDIDAAQGSGGGICSDYEAHMFFCCFRGSRELATSPAFIPARGSAALAAIAARRQTETELSSRRSNRSTDREKTNTTEFSATAADGQEINPPRKRTVEPPVHKSKVVKSILRNRPTAERALRAPINSSVDQVDSVRPRPRVEFAPQDRVDLGRRVAEYEADSASVIGSMKSGTGSVGSVNSRVKLSKLVEQVNSKRGARRQPDARPDRNALLSPHTTYKPMPCKPMPW